MPPDPGAPGCVNAARPGRTRLCIGLSTTRSQPSEPLHFASASALCPAGWTADSDGERRADRRALMDEELSSTQWRTLQLTPLWVFSAIVGRQRDFDPLELAAFWRAVDEAAAGADGLAKAVPESLSANFAVLLKDFETEQRSVVTGLWDVVIILNGLDREVSRPLVATVLEIGERLCRARGSFGRVISRED